MYLKKLLIPTTCHNPLTLGEGLRSIEQTINGPEWMGNGNNADNIATTGAIFVYKWKLHQHDQGPVLI